MPELPEVETIRLGVERHLVGRTLTDIELHSSRATRHEANLGAYAALADRQVREVARRGKFLWLVPEGGRSAPVPGAVPGAPMPDGAPCALVIHLGMSGQLLHHASPPLPPLRHTAATLHLDDGAALLFVDQRTFGYLRTSVLVPTPDGQPGGAGTEEPLVPQAVSHIARDPLDPHFDVEGAVARIARTSSAIKRVLLDQRYVSGVGNIYADETLWAARIHPETPASSIPEGTIEDVLRHAEAVMRSAVAVGGTSFDSLYVDTAGEAGYFARELSAYGRAGAKCRRCGRLIEKLVVGGRATYVCTTCQVRGTATSERIH